MKKYLIRELRKDEAIPYDLLLLADPSRSAIDDYINRGLSYVCIDDNEIIGIYVLIWTRPHTLELVNISVKENRQKEGIGKKLVLDAIQKSKSLRAKCLELGTGNSSLAQLGLYQKCGFRIAGIDKDFFVRNYSFDIIENGIRCVDMIRLRMELK